MWKAQGVHLATGAIRLLHYKHRLKEVGNTGGNDKPVLVKIGP